MPIGAPDTMCTSVRYYDRPRRRPCGLTRMTRVGLADDIDRKGTDGGNGFLVSGGRLEGHGGSWGKKEFGGLSKRNIK